MTSSNDIFDLYKHLFDKIRRENLNLSTDSDELPDNVLKFSKVDN